MRERDIYVFDLYFSSLVGMTLHPGFHREGTPQKDLWDCAYMAVRMLEIRSELLNPMEEENG